MTDLSADAGRIVDAPTETAGLIELLFFAYRDFTSGPDAVLAERGFGRAHHRVIHFVDRNPGLTVAELLDILKITKQSLARVLKALVDSGLVRQSPGVSDRRQRRLSTTERGHALARRLSDLQADRIAAALAGHSSAEVAAVRAFLVGMIDASERPTSLRLTGTRHDRAAP